MNHSQHMGGGAGMGQMDDVDEVIPGAEATATLISGRMKFDVTGEGRVIQAIQRMVVGHARAMEG